MSGTKFPQQLFEGALRIFEIKRPDIGGKAAERKAAALETRLREKDTVIAEPAQEVLALKKIPMAGTREGEDES